MKFNNTMKTTTLLLALAAVPVHGGDHPFETDEHREPSMENPGAVVIRGVTIHTALRPAFVGSVLVDEGKIAAISEGGADLNGPEGTLVIDGAGMHLAPGVVDTHSHTAIERGVNEGTESITAEVTMEDVIDPDDIGIYRALAGGVTTTRLLHGSANAIGGRDAVLKLRWHEDADALRFKGAEEGIKFALGENPKRSNWGRGASRYPATRMGIESIYYRAFERAREYAAEWDAYESAKREGQDVAPPRRDVRLDVLANILEQDVIVHSHCYRADEILMLIRAAEHFGFRIGTLQHVLEGYKVAWEMAQAGVPGSAFADWWGYKVEAYDAIPHAPAIMHDAGVLTSINSDSDEMMRRLYEEAAKSVRYADMDRVVALQMVTLAGAKQLGIEDRVGSIEVGKDADLVLLNGDPLSSLSRVHWTMVDGQFEFTRRDAFQLDTEAPVVTELEEPDRELPEGHSGPVTALVGGTIHPVTGPVIEKGFLLMQGDRIVAVGDGEFVPDGARVIDVTGHHVWPGMITMGSAVGLQEIGAVRATVDTSEIGGNQPDIRVTASIHAESAHIGVTRHNGVTRAQTSPQGGGPIRGQSAVIKLEGYTWEEMLTRDRDMLHISFPVTSNDDPDSAHCHDHDEICGHAVEGWHCDTSGAVKTTLMEEGERRKDREDNAATKALRELFEEAREYGRLVDHSRASGAEAPAHDPRLEALVPFLRGERQVALWADNAQSILLALKFADEEGLDAVIYGGREAWKIVDVLAAAEVPVVVGPVWSLPTTRFDPYDAAFANAAVLARAGVPFAIMTRDSENERNLPFHAAKAAAFGLPVEEAVRSVTYYPARILGLEDELGSLRVGKRADVVVTRGHLLEIDAACQHLFIDGVEVDLQDDKHSQLNRRYRERLERVRVR